ncbi:hypothetical protein [Mycobacterium nebraskense]|uniref:DUF4190 domain-containing protein n=1 Tax=Mycobacterium nebraskense TaxID=244292 RepID=A0A0F5N7L5_9MYCO|nr:hypothetical protein [Mycobacterium nebraskense]KKC03021.1 hypothetical protein WU83_21185 [Mycobacterium nebraskense]KLO43101.1 hypothetical protein ABW17_10725 [Mycobacterium nebraskense]MBI2696974.1 hypothetical protein [Mycobacterium nebraskense]MCV7118042.1 hypothetical protein [Mycobacterium nebraskense]ORW19474.1 hypothetical protein AWC17_08990 [Mycobacterium nebraskense]
MADESVIEAAKSPYGPITFLVAVLHILVVEFATWLFMPYSIVFVLPVVLFYLAISALVMRAPGQLGQIGRGMFIGSLSGPLSLLIFGAVWAIANAIGPI